jgi:hypothetical protein
MHTDNAVQEGMFGDVTAMALPSVREVKDSTACRLHGNRIMTDRSRWL